jgi:hypothetical protein
MERSPTPAAVSVRISAGAARLTPVTSPVLQEDKSHGIAEF